MMKLQASTTNLQRTIDIQKSKAASRGAESMEFGTSLQFRVLLLVVG
jgi:hypothetical protein